MKHGEILLMSCCSIIVRSRSYSCILPVSMLFSCQNIVIHSISQRQRPNFCMQPLSCLVSSYDILYKIEKGWAICQILLDSNACIDSIAFSKCWLSSEERFWGVIFFGLISMFSICLINILFFGGLTICFILCCHFIWPTKFGFEAFF